MNGKWRKIRIVALGLLPVAAALILTSQLVSFVPSLNGIHDFGAAIAAWIKDDGAIGQAGESAALAAQKMEEAYSALLKSLNRELEAKQVHVSQSDRKINIVLLEKVLFHSGSAEITEQGKQLLGKLDVALKGVAGKHIFVVGHTDDEPIANSDFASNWELSTARASSVIRFLIDKKDFVPEVFYALGRADQQPAAGNDTEEGRAANRRVEIIIADIPDLVPAS